MITRARANVRVDPIGVAHVLAAWWQNDADGELRRLFGVKAFNAIGHLLEKLVSQPVAIEEERFMQIVLSCHRTVPAAALLYDVCNRLYGATPVFLDAGVDLASLRDAIADDLTHVRKPQAHEGQVK